MTTRKRIEKTLKKSFRIIRRNYGCPGNDGVSIQTVKAHFDTHLKYIAEQILNDEVMFEESPKISTIIDYMGNPRNVLVYNLYERWIQEYVRMETQETIGAFLSNHVYGYIRGKKDIEAYEYILEPSPAFVIRLDIRRFFETINREKLFEMINDIGLDPAIVRLTKKSFASYPAGLPQGHVMSPLLSNFYLHKFDSNFSEGYTRFADDMIFRMKSREESVSLISLVDDLLAKLDLKLNNDKTIIIQNPTLEKLR